MINLINSKKPDLILVDTEIFKAIFVVGEKKLSLDLKDEFKVKQFRTVVENMDTYERRDDQGKLIGYRMNWNYVTEEEPKLLPKADTKEVMFEIIHDMIVKENLLGVVVTSTGTLVKDKKEVTTLNFNSSIVKTVYDEYSQEESNAVGKIIKSIEVNGTSYELLMWKIEDEVSARITRKISSLDGVVMMMPSEMKSRVRQINNGLIVTSIDPLIKMEHVIPMMTEVDPNFRRLACSVGNLSNLLSEDLPSQYNLNNLDGLKDTHYKYIIVSNISTSKELEDVLNLMYSGKTIIIGFENDSVYAHLISLLTLCRGESFNNNKVLMSTLGFIHPILKITDGKLNLEDSECVTLSSNKARSIIDGDLSKEKFNTLIEHPSKVYTLGTSSSKFLSQEEEFKALLKKAVDEGVSDIHLAVGASPMFRIQGDLIPISKDIKLTPKALEHITSLLVISEFQKQSLEESKEIYMPYSAPGIGRFRVQISTQRGTYYIAIRHTAAKIPTVSEIKLPQVLLDAVLNNPKGLVIVTGPTGSGKSTTSAVLIDQLKLQDSYVITSLADPIEFLHGHGKGIVVQREIPSDVHSFDSGLLAAFRSDPDIVEVAEMRTPDSIHAVMRFANSGHLVITTYHSPSVIGTFDAIFNRIEADRRSELLSTLSQNVVAIINQTLVEGTNGKLYPIFEYLIPDRNIRMAIADYSLPAIESAMKTSARGMKTVASWGDYELLNAFKEGHITEETLNKYLTDKNVMVDFNGMQ